MRTFLAFLFIAAPFGVSADVLPIYQTTVASGLASPMSAEQANKPVRADTDLRRALKSACQDQAYCLEFTGDIIGTGFIFGDSSLLVTGVHNMRGFLKSFWTHVNPGQLENIRIPLVLKQSGQLIFGAPGDVAIVNMTAEARQAIMSDSLERNPDLDLVYVRLSRELAEPLSPATGKSSSIQAVGYVTTNMQIFSGQIVSPPTTITLTNLFSKTGIQAIRFGNYYGANGADKLSGSPILNDRQEVVGMHIGQLNRGQADAVRYFLPLGDGY